MNRLGMHRMPSGVWQRLEPAEHHPFVQFLEGYSKAFLGVIGEDGSRENMRIQTKEHHVTDIWVKDQVSTRALLFCLAASRH